MTARSLLCVLGLLTFSVNAPAQPKSDPAKLLGQTPDSGSLPFWSKPSVDAQSSLGKIARSHEHGVLIAGSPETTFGTAWVISRKHRLLITNAHVADLFHEGKGTMFAIPNGTSQVYRVSNVYYHPGVRRYSKSTGGFSIRSSDPQDGDVDPRSPDLAVLRLTADGPELTIEFPLATQEELGTLFAQPAAIFGFPGHDTKEWPKLGGQASATYHAGVISRMTDFELNVGGPEAEKQFVQYTMSTWGGFSGSPIFLPSGRVAAVHNMARKTDESPQGEVKTIPHGIRADCVLELLVHHKLDDKVPFPIDKSKISLDRWLKPDQRSEQAREGFAKAILLASEAEYLARFKKDYETAEKKCNEAIKLAPSYARGYYVRCLTLHNFIFDMRDRLADEAKLPIHKQACADGRRACQLDPNDPENIIIFCTATNGLGFTSQNLNYFRDSLAILNEMLGSDNLSDPHRGRAHSMRGNCYDNLEDIDRAWREHNEAIRLAPDNPNVRDTRGRFLESRELGDFGRADHAKAAEIRAATRESGLKITDLGDGAAKTAGLRSDDVIVSIAGKRVRTFEQLTAALSGVRGKADFVILRDGNPETVSVTPAAGKIGAAVVQVDLK